MNRIVLGGLIAAASAALTILLGSSYVMARGRAEGIESVEKMLKMASKGQYAEIESSRLAAGHVVAWLRERDERWGKVKSIAFEDAYVQILGTPWGVTMRVWRERKAVREIFGGHRSMVGSADVPWPEAEK